MFRDRCDAETAPAFYREAAELDNYFIEAYYWVLKLVPEDDRKGLTAEVRLYMRPRR